MIGLAAMAAARGLYFAATMLLFGELAFGLLMHAKLPVILPPRDMRLRWGALAVAAVMAVAWLVLAVRQMAGAFNLAALRETVSATLFGRLFALRLLTLAALLALVALTLPAATSHAAAASPAGFTVLGASLDAVHLATAGFWLGGLAALLQLHRRNEPNMLLALSLFSEWAMVAVLLLVMTGLIDAVSVLLGDAGTPSLAYVAVLGAKLALVAAMLGLAAMNRFRLMPQGADRTIARNASLELGAGVIAVLLAGLLGQLQPTL
jgi:putative copper export protein